MKRSLGTIMVEAGLITQEQLDESLELQKAHGEKLASILVRQNHLTEKFAVTYLGRQLGIPGADLSKHTISLDLFRLMPLHVCSSRLVFPLRLEDGELELAMADPLNKPLVAQLSREHEVRLRPFIALEASIKNAVEEATAATKAGLRTFTPGTLHDRLATLSLDRRALLPPQGTGPLSVAAPDGNREAPVVERLGGGTIDYDRNFTKTGLKRVSGEPAADDVAPPAAIQAPRKVVLVDANPETRQGLVGLLGRSEKLRVAGVGTTAEALPLLAEAPLLVVRQGPSHESFLDLCRQARVLRAGLRIILITPTPRGWAYQMDVCEAFGVDLVLGPPLDGPRLREQVEELVGLGTAPPAEREAAVQKSLKAGMAALKAEKIDDAVQALQEGLSEDPRSDLLHYYLATAYERKGSSSEAIESYEAAVDTNPGFEDALVRLATLYERAGMRRKSVEIWQRVLSAISDPSARERLKAHIMELL